MTDFNSVIKNILDSTNVQYKTLGELATEPMFKGAGITRKELSESGTPCIRYADIYTIYGPWFEKPSTFMNVTDSSKIKYAESGDILFAITGEKVEDIAKSTAYVGSDPIAVGGDIVVFRHGQDAKYMGYVLSTPMAQKQKSYGKVKSKVVHSSIPDLSKIVVPIPSLEVQHAIVEVLDALSVDLVNVQEESSLRNVQFDYYLHSVIGDLYRDSKMVCVGKVADVSTGSSNKADSVTDGRYPFFVRSATIEHKDDYEFDEKAIIIPGEGGIGDIFHYVDGKYALHQRVYRVHFLDESIDPKFAYYCFKAMFKSYIATETVIATVSSIRKPMVEGFSIPMISKDEQCRIVDMFDAMSNNIAIIDDMMDLRTVQFEYYRDLILSFGGVES